MELPAIDLAYQVEVLVDLLNIPSPTGFAHMAVDFVEKELRNYPELTITHTRKGALVATFPGEKADSPRAMTAHLDTLGAMIKEVKSNGRLKLTKIGGYAWNTVEGEGCTVFASHP